MGMEPGVTRLSEFYGLDYAQALEVFRPLWNHLSATELTPMPGARELLIRLKDEGVSMALVTSADPVHAQSALTAVDVPGAFECVVDADMVSRLKPSPEPYLKAAECLGVSPPEHARHRRLRLRRGVSPFSGNDLCRRPRRSPRPSRTGQARVKIPSLADFPAFT